MTSPGTSSTLWLRRFHPGADRPVRLVCFPHAGGSASFYHPVSAALGARAEVIALQYPGRQDRRLEPCVEDIDTLADRITDELLTLDERPTVFFGHSMGAVLAFETAWRLERKGTHAPGAVIASGRRAPSTTRTETVHQRDDEGVIAELKLLNGTSAHLLGDEEILRMAMPAIRADYRAVERYTCGPERVLGCPITALTGDADPRTTVAEARAWQDHTSGAFRLQVLPGGHFFLAEQQAAVLREITSELAALR
ncbi:thioesterase II family protein [Streptomyces sp. CBMA123]|uniref:thioesterase II family protein n=1 Tax=Streptomyces sp. CBMA123 TaxID=1896313 RepID=UPI0016620EFE|nr:alpha/beta fold hydrolase [Streptomyces sp. CBMA123]MBD0693931.1 oleoyl-ACP hydrolase [Streptomyces sp. CBMA123]